jgi:hypothetical protein
MTRLARRGCGASATYLASAALAVLLASQVPAQEAHTYRSPNASGLRSDAVIGNATTILDPSIIPIEKAPAAVSESPRNAAAPNPNLNNLLLANASFARLQALFNDPRMLKIDTTLRESLAAENREVTTRRDSLLPHARELDARNAAIQQEADQLNAERKKNEVEKTELQALLEDHRRQCNPAPNQAIYQWCLGNEARLNPRIDSYNRRVAEHNEKVEAWKKRSADMRTAWDDFWKIANLWEEAVLQLEKKILHLLEHPMTERCKYVARGTNNLCIYLCPSGVRYWPPDANGDCPKPYADLPIDDGGVGADRSFAR